MKATIAIDRRHRIGRIDTNIYGHFLESAFFGNIEGGVFDEGSPLSIDEPGHRNGLRRDVLELCRELGVPLVRWPGGNFTSPYHWQDGIGPRDERPRRLELAWGEEESNRFGTDEFLTWCAEIGAEAYLAHSCRDVDDAVRWVEYTNYAGDTELTRRRRSYGHEKPYGVRYWGLGNEVYGPWQMGYRPATEYAAAAREHGLFMRRVDPSIKLIAVGYPTEEWTEPVLAKTGTLIDYISIHLYGASTHLYTGSDDYDAIVAQPLFFEQRIQDYAHLVADLTRRAGIERPIGLALDEWNIRHLEPTAWPEPKPSDDGGFADREQPDLGRTPHPLRVNRWSPRTVADAIFYAGVFHALHRASGLAHPVTMANTVNLVNANGLVVARPGGAIRSASYHVWDLYRKHAGCIVVSATVEGPARTAAVRQGDLRDGAGGFETRPAAVPHLDVSATLTDDEETLCVAVINRDPAATIPAELALDGRAAALPTRARVHQLGADIDDVLASNSLSEPDRVGLRDLGERPVDGGFDFPPHSVTMLRFALAG